MNIADVALCFGVPIVALIGTYIVLRLFFIINHNSLANEGRKFNFEYGGICVIIAIFAALGYFYFVADLFNMHHLLDVDGRFGKKLLPVAMVILCTGILEEQYKLGKFISIIFQILIALIAWRIGIDIQTIFKIPLPPLISLVVTTLWFLLIFNFYNVGDELGHAGFVSTIISFALIIFIFFKRDINDIFIATILGAVSIGILLNSFSDKTFRLGVVGSRFIGFYVGVLTIYFFQKSVIIYAITVIIIIIFCVHSFQLLYLLWKRTSGDVEDLYRSEHDVDNLLNEGNSCIEIIRKFRFKLMGIFIDVLDLQSVLKLIDKKINEGDIDGYILAVNPLKVYSIRYKPFLNKFFSEAFLLIPDGVGIVKAIYLILGFNIERIAGADLMIDICELAEEKGHKVFFYGSKEDVSKNAVNALSDKYPKLKIAGRQNGYISDDKMDILIDNINRSQADILFISLGSPRQEEWIYKYRKQLTSVKIFQGVGGTLDTIAGSVNRAPHKWQGHNVEWLYRIIKEPSKRIAGLFLLMKFSLEVFGISILKKRFSSFYNSIVDTDRKTL